MNVRIIIWRDKINENKPNNLAHLLKDQKEVNEREEVLYGSVQEEESVHQEIELIRANNIVGKLVQITNGS